MIIKNTKREAQACACAYEAIHKSCHGKMEDEVK